MNAGSITLNINQNAVEVARSVNDNSPPPSVQPCPRRTNVTRTILKQSLKVELIAEVKKHAIIWENQKKDGTDLEGAWLSVRKALSRKKQKKVYNKWSRITVPLLKNQWKLLLVTYRKKVKTGRISIDNDMYTEMHSFLKTASTAGQPDTEAKKKTSAATATPNPNVGTCNGNKNSLEETSLSIIDFFKNNKPEGLKSIEKSLVEKLIQDFPQVAKKIIEHGKQVVSTSNDVGNSDWSALDYPADICQAVWDHHVIKVMLGS